MVSFKQIQLVGFKSFADKTTIPLTEGVTCIVGPNGCGKSNVADSIRWVLGEQSAKTMRGTQMTDVIFGGTEKRKQMSFCEVTLTFDNTNRIFDIDCDEVEMTRRLYRDGDSEYLLNRQPSRMKVLTGLLHGAGAAKEGYSIIGQGRIAQIMNSRPEERRSIFEEATGIVVFKDRKADAERKLAYSKDNLFVFCQRMQEVERQLAPLAKAAENARKYQELYSQLRHHEMNQYIIRHDGAADERKKYNDKIEKINAQIATLTAHLDGLLKEYTDKRDELTRADDVLKDLNERLLRYTVGIEHKSGEARVLKEKANSVKSKLLAAREDISYSAKRIEEIEREIRRSEDYNGKNSDRMNAIKNACAQLSEEINLISKQIADYEYRTGEHRKKVLDTFKDLSDLRQNMGSLSAQKDLIKERLTEMGEAMEKVKFNWEDKKNEYSESLKLQGELSAFLGSEASVLEEANEKVRESSERLQLLIKQIYDIKAQISSLKESLITSRSLRERFEGYTYSVKNLLNAAKSNGELSSRIQGLIADVVSTPKEYEVAIETAFGGAMQNVITATRDDAKYLIEYLKRTRAGQVTFLPIEALRPRFENEQIKLATRERGAIGFAVNLVKFNKKYENVIHNLLGNTLIVDNITNATIIATRFPRAFKIVTLDGDVISTTGSMSGGSRKEQAGNLLAVERRIKETEDLIIEREEQVKRAEIKRDTTEEDKNNAEYELEQLRGRLQNSKVELAAIEERQSLLLKQVASSEAEYSAYSQSYRALEERLLELDSEYTSTSKGASNLSALSTEANDAIEDLSIEYEKLIKERTQKLEKLNRGNVEVASLESAVKASGQTVERLNGEKETLLLKIAKTREVIPQIEKELSELNMQAEHSALTAEEQAVVDDLRRQQDKVSFSKVQLNERIKQIDAERLSSYEESENLKVRVHNAEMALAKIDSDLENMQVRISEEYGETYEGCLQYKEEGYDITQAPAQIANCKRQLTMLGPVNHNAIVEYDEINERYQKMTVEKEDLEKGIADLTTALEDIRSEMLKIFDEGFNTINENFKRTFKELFGGGKAELQLDYTDCDDPLNAGVEIVACPPGKSLKKISLLSGGEQALTAIAILFAIIQMRPMPFCVLDEIEAALDEANVGRYARYLKKFSQETQFIVITHRKPTMENADVLFGVTMEEKGVSKIVSVKLSEVQEKLGGDTVE
ncbi:MAG: chromosome segregation protein SMC [Clostridiales bacterium]|nr:chromosome segregation protein SMC [Clostridiales bacterium]